MAQQPRIGFVGLGRMGAPMARRLLAAGYALTVHNRSPRPAEELAAAGATAVATPGAVTEAADIVLTCLTDPPAVETVYFGPGGLFAPLRAGQIVIDHSTVGPDLSHRCADEASARGAHFLDAPISGGVARATDGTLTMMVGGDAGAFARAEPVLRAMGANVVRVGPSGAGTVVKLANQLLVGINTAGVVEALVLAARAGADPELVLQVLGTSFGGSAMLNRNVPLMLDRRFDVGTTVNLLFKDLNIIDDLATDLGVRLLMGGQARQVFGECRALGLGDDDIAGAVRPLEKLAGITLARTEPPPG